GVSPAGRVRPPVFAFFGRDGLGGFPRRHLPISPKGVLMRSWVCLVVLTLSLIVLTGLTGGCSKTETPSEKKSQSNPKEIKGRKDKGFPEPPEPIKLP